MTSRAAKSLLCLGLQMESAGEYGLPRRVLGEKQNCGDKAGWLARWVIVCCRGGGLLLLETSVAGVSDFQSQ